MNLKQYIRDIPDFPKPGILFRDITPLLYHQESFRFCVDAFAKKAKIISPDVIVGIESRGFIMAGALAYNLGAAFVPLRKPEKLPYDTYSVSYDLEYGSTDMHIHIDALRAHKKLLIIDDLLATGGTVLASLDLIRQFEGKEVVGAGFVINLPLLGGVKKLESLNINTKFLIR